MPHNRKVISADYRFLADWKLYLFATLFFLVAGGFTGQIPALMEYVGLTKIAGIKALGSYGIACAISVLLASFFIQQNMSLATALFIGIGCKLVGILGLLQFTLLPIHLIFACLFILSIGMGFISNAIKMCFMLKYNDLESQKALLFLNFVGTIGTLLGLCLATLAPNFRTFLAFCLLLDGLGSLSLSQFDFSFEKETYHNHQGLLLLGTGLFPALLLLSQQYLALAVYTLWLLLCYPQRVLSLFMLCMMSNAYHMTSQPGSSLVLALCLAVSLGQVIIVLRRHPDYYRDSQHQGVFFLACTIPSLFLLSQSPVLIYFLSQTQQQLKLFHHQVRAEVFSVLVYDSWYLLLNPILYYLSVGSSHPLLLRLRPSKTQLMHATMFCCTACAFGILGTTAVELAILPRLVLYYLFEAFGNQSIIPNVLPSFKKHFAANILSLVFGTYTILQAFIATIVNSTILPVLVQQEYGQGKQVFLNYFQALSLVSLVLLLFYVGHMISARETAPSALPAA